MSTKYKGIVNGMNFEKLSDSDIKKLIELGVFVFYYKYNSDDDVVLLFYGELNEPRHFLHQIVFNDDVYIINSEVIDEIFPLITKGIKGSYAIDYALPTKLNQIKLELSRNVLPLERESFVKRLVNEEFESFKEKYADDEDSLWSAGLSSDKPETLEFEKYIKSLIHDSLTTIWYHLIIGSYDNQNLEYLEEDIMDEFNYIGYWKDWIWYNRILDVSSQLLANPKKKKEKKSRPLSEIFIEKNEYSSLIKKLEEEGVITNELKLIVDDSDVGKLMSAISFLLQKTPKLKKHFDYELAEAVGNEFGRDLPPTTYSDHKAFFERYYNIPNSYEKHLDRLHFIIPK